MHGFSGYKDFEQKTLALQKKHLSKSEFEKEFSQLQDNYSGAKEFLRKANALANSLGQAALHLGNYKTASLKDMESAYQDASKELQSAVTALGL